MALSDNGAQPQIKKIEAKKDISSQQPTARKMTVLHGFKPDSKAKDKKQEILKLKFLDNYFDEMTVTHTLAVIGVDHPTFERWKDTDRAFSKAYSVCYNAVTDRMKRVAIARGIRGSDNLLMFVMKQQDPSFRDRMLTEMDPKVVENIVNALVLALRKNIPDSCPHCKNNLHLTEKVTRMLATLSSGFER